MKLIIREKEETNMNLTIDNKLESKSVINNDVDSFIKELDKSLEKNQDFQSTIEIEVLRDIPLATKYKNQIEDVINKYFEEMSYEQDFFYFDYDKKENKYYLDYYSEGKIERIEIPEQEIEESKLEKGWFYAWYDNEQIVEANSIKEGIKSNIETELDIMNFNEKKRGVRK